MIKVIEIIRRKSKTSNYEAELYEYDYEDEESDAALVHIDDRRKQGIECYIASNKQKCTERIRLMKMSKEEVIEEYLSRGLIDINNGQ